MNNLKIDAVWSPQWKEELNKILKGKLGLGNIYMKYSHGTKVKRNKKEKVKSSKILCYKLKSKNIYKIKTKFKVQRFKISDSKLGYTEIRSEIMLKTL